jgi:hypothetical protein
MKLVRKNRRIYINKLKKKYSKISDMSIMLIKLWKKLNPKLHFSLLILIKLYSGWYNLKIWMGFLRFGKINLKLLMGMKFWKMKML